MSIQEITPSEDDIVEVFDIIFESFEISASFQEKIIAKLRSKINNLPEYKLTIHSKRDDVETVFMHDLELGNEMNIMPEIIISMIPERFQNLYYGLATSKRVILMMYKHNFYRFKLDYI